MYDFLAYRKITEADADLLLGWRTASHVAPYMLSQVQPDPHLQRAWIRSCEARPDYAHRIIRIEGRDVGYCSITTRDRRARVGELGVYIGELATPKALSIYNFLGTANHALFTLGLKKLVNHIVADNQRTLRLQAFNGYEAVATLPGHAVKEGLSQKVHVFELTRERWHSFRTKFAYFKDWDGNPT